MGLSYCSMENSARLSVFWFRRDLRIADNHGLYQALAGPHPVLPLFIFDTDILDRLADPRDARMSFLHDSITHLHAKLLAAGGGLLVEQGKPIEVWRRLFEKYPIAAIYTNRDYEPYAKERDGQIQQLAEENGIIFRDFKDHVVFDRNEVVKGNGSPYVVFTPYSKVWRKRLLVSPDERPPLAPYPSEKHLSKLFSTSPPPIPSLGSLGFERSDIPIPPPSVSQKRIRDYSDNRDYPAIEGTSKLGIHFRFGTISIREKARKAQALNDTFLSELIWRDFYAQILDHFPHVATAPFRAKYAHIRWRQDEEDFEKWCAGQTGYPIVDAGMRELNATGFMHNRVRMIVASFLTKHLLIDWRWGEAYFAEKLLDFDLASNNGGWQWAAGTGTDAAPYFRIFNPESQMKKFDREMRYVMKWVPEYGTPAYPKPMVDHKYARLRCLETYKEGILRAESLGEVSA